MTSEAITYNDTAIPDKKNPDKDLANMKYQNESAKADKLAMKETIAKQKNMTGFLPKLSDIHPMTIVPKNAPIKNIELATWFR